MVYYIRDEEGSLIGFKYNNTLYYYIKNMQEDIIGITDSNYNLLCSYEYDSWGKLISIKDNNGSIITNTSHIGYINPFRYRSYYYDNETKLYYLNSRYYNPEWGRFINCDSLIKAEENKYNLYMYCKDNPIKYIDYNGSFALAALGGAVAGAALGKAAAGALAVGAAGLIYYAYKGLVNITEEIVEDILTHKPYESKSNKNDKDDKKDYYVYALKDPNNNFNVEYVGRTKNLNSARSRHQSNPYRSHLVLKTLTGPLTYEQSRVREQYYIKYYKTLNKYNKMNNQINGLSPNKYGKYRTIIDELGEDLTYVGGSLW